MMNNRAGNILRSFWTRKWYLSVTAGILLGLSFPPIPLPFLIIPAWVLLFRVIELSSTFREAALFSYISFVIWNLVTTYWLLYATVIAGIAAILANAAVMTLPFIAQYFFQKKLNKVWIISVFQTSAWVSFEFLHHQWDLAWPWLSLGNAWANAPELIQYISVTGYLGISFWLLLISALTYHGLERLQKRPLASAAVIAVLLPVISLIQYHTAEYKSDRTLETVVVQPNFDTYEEYGGFPDAQSVMNLLLRMSDSLRNNETDMIVWPENAIRSTLYSRNELNVESRRVTDQLLRYANKWNTTIISGTTFLEFYTPDNRPALPRLAGGTDPYLYYNAGLGFQPDSSIQIYRKHNLVPVVERIPFVHFLHAVDIFSWINWRTLQGYGKGYDPDAIDVNGTETPTLVCYDSVFPGWVRKFVKNDAGLLTIITNDGWWGNTSGHEQHWAYARLRAIEFRRWIVRSANNGISGIMDPTGRIQVETEYWDRTAFRAEVPVLEGITVYARFGDWLSWISLFVTAAGIVVVAARSGK